MRIYSLVTRSAQTPETPRPALRWLAAMCAAMVFLLGLLAASPELHARVHNDADHEGHACAVTLFSHGADPAAIGVDCVVAPMAPVFVALVPEAPREVQSVVDRLMPGRGPPVR